jgi:hypothetical protein
MSLLTKLGIFALIVLVMGFSVWLAAHEAYERGVSDTTATMQKQIDAATAKANALAASLYVKNAALSSKIEDQTAPQVAAIPAQTAQKQKIIVETIHDTPTYASATRPVVVERVRTSDLADLAALASQSAAAAPASSAPVPAAISSSASQLDGARIF